jgi:hypothetical protein
MFYPFKTPIWTLLSVFSSPHAGALAVTVMSESSYGNPLSKIICSGLCVGTVLYLVTINDTVTL